MMFQNPTKCIKGLLLAGLLASSRANKTILCAGLLAGNILFSGVVAPSSQEHAIAEKEKPSGTQLTTLSPTPIRKSAQLIATSGLNSSARRFYQLTWGVDILGVKVVSSGSMLRFSYRVLDTKKAKVLNDKKLTPHLFDLATGAKLEIPSMEKVGQLRQTATPEDGRIYWMIFGNTDSLVKRGSRVDVVIGTFRAEGLVVQ
jgi:hypothetical protein